jgi:phosphoglycolate phosphatase
VTSLPALVLFDLDGTLVDPAGAITGGISRALQLAGLPVPQQDVLDSMIGPPLGQSLREKAGVPESDIAEVIRLYRTEYRLSGMAASRVYPGMEALLQQLKTEGTILAVATQKPTPIADELLRVQGLTAYFTVSMAQASTIRAAVPQLMQARSPFWRRPSGSMPVPTAAW